jgi:hypothetical protein
VIARDYLDVRADPNVVFSYLANINEKGLKVTNKNPVSRQVFFSTGVSLFSWGESIEITVQQIEGGSRVLFRGQGKLPFNITANPKGPIGLIVNKLRTQFEMIA